MIKIILSILFLGTAIVIFLGPAKKNWEDINALVVEKRDFNTALSNSRELMKLRDDLIAKYNEIPSEDLARLDKLIPSNAGEMELAVEIENLIKNHGLSLKDIQVETSGKDKVDMRNPVGNSNIDGGIDSGFDPIYLDISFGGSYKPFLSFIGDIENGLRLMEIESLSFISEESDQYDYKIKIKTYSKKIN